MEPQPPRTRNPHTKARIDREAFWQIWVPISLGILLLVAALVWVILPGAAGVRSPIADVSLVLLIVVWATMALVILILVAALAFGLGWLLRESPYWFKRGQDITWIVSQQTRSTTSQIAEAVTSTNALGAALARLIARLRAAFSRE